MSLPQRDIFRVAALLGASHLLLASLPAQTAINNTVSAPAGSGLARPLVSRPPAPPKPVPPFGSPISFFRELLAMNAAEREQALTNRSPENRSQILAKVREYESLKPDERELRLRVTELRWYLLPLMTTPATNRPARLAAIPEQDRKLVEDRLQEWDKLPSDMQKELLANQATISYLADIEGRTAEQRRQMLENISPARREMLEQGINKWDSMSEDQRRKMLDRFKEFFDLTVEEKKKALSTLSEPERRQIEKTLQTFGSLTPAQRAQCIRSFEKFASLSLEERQQFLKDAERWKLMPIEQRQAWKDLVTRLSQQPPMPPLPPRPHLPPLPPSPRLPESTPSIVTNRN